MRYDACLLALFLAGTAPPDGGHIEPAPPSFLRVEPGSRVEIGEGRVVELKVKDGHFEVQGAGRVDRLSPLDFANPHVLAADVTGDGVSDLLVEVLPSMAGSCYELWSPTAERYSRHEDLFCNPSLAQDGAVVTNERDGPHSRITEYQPDQGGRLRWVRKQEPLSPDFSRFERRKEDGSIVSSVIYLGLPECGEARVTVPHPVRVSGEPGGAATQELEGELRVLDVQAANPPDEWVRVRTREGAEGWLPSASLGDLETASRGQCDTARDSIVRDRGPLVFQNKIGSDRYREVVLRDGTGTIRLVPAQEGYFEDVGPTRISHGGIVRLHEIATGPAADAGQPLTHDRYYCTFVSVRTGCVYARETGSVCDGTWNPDGQWVTTGGELVDVTAWRITAEEVASGLQELGEQIDNSYENLLRCDRPAEGNRSHYEVIGR